MPRVRSLGQSSRDAETGIRKAEELSAQAATSWCLFATPPQFVLHDTFRSSEPYCIKEWTIAEEIYFEAAELTEDIFQQLMLLANSLFTN